MKKVYRVVAPDTLGLRIGDKVELTENQARANVNKVELVGEIKVDKKAAKPATDAWGEK